MHSPQRESFVIQVSGCEALPQASVSPKFNFSAMKLFNSFRKILMRLLFSLPSRGSSATSGMASRQKNCDRFEPPKTSCSSYYSSHSHYNEAIADCIEFFNKSSQDGILDSRNSDVMNCFSCGLELNRLCGCDSWPRGRGSKIRSSLVCFVPDKPN